MPTKLQDDWVTDVFGVDVAAFAPATPANGGGGGPIGETGQTGDHEKVGVAPLVVVVIGGAKYLTRELIANVTIRNNTPYTLTLDQSGTGFNKGGLKSGAPSISLAPATGSTSFTAHSESIVDFLSDVPLLGKLIGRPSLSGIDGEVRYLIGDTKATWTIHFVVPRLVLLSKEGGGQVDPASTTVAHDNSPKPPSGDNWSFDLLGSGGVQPGPNNGGLTAVTCRVTVENDSDQTIYLRKESNSGSEFGEFITNPKKMLKPGDSTDFMYGAAANDPQRQCRGKLFWDVGDPALTQWELMWDNRVQMNNISASFLTPDNVGFHTLDQIDNGDENVPASFTLSGKSVKPPSDQTANYTVAVNNKTDADLVFDSAAGLGGKLQPQPPATLAAGASVQLKLAMDGSTGGGQGSLVWKVGDGGSTWTNEWTIPAAGDPTVQATVDPANPSLTSDAKTIELADETGLTFTVTGTAGPPDQPDDDFAPPPSSKQPTLRKGDDDSDGWVEYAQRLLNKWALGKGQPKDNINGNFDGAMEAKVKAFQTDRQCSLVDGIIGNETWSLLREGPKENVGTDGRKPHSFKETGPQGRFVTERADVTGYDASDDHYFIWVVSTGEQPLDDYKATMKVTQPDGTSHTHSVAIGPVTLPSGDGQGDFHTVLFRPFKRIFKLKPGVEPTSCSIDAYLPQEIGGDRLQVQVAPPTPPPGTQPGQPATS